LHGDYAYFGVFAPSAAMICRHPSCNRASQVSTEN